MRSLRVLRVGWSTGRAAPTRHPIDLEQSDEVILAIVDGPRGR